MEEETKILEGWNPLNEDNLPKIGSTISIYVNEELHTQFHNLWVNKLTIFEKNHIQIELQYPLTESHTYADEELMFFSRSIVGWRYSSK